MGDIVPYTFSEHINQRLFRSKQISESAARSISHFDICVRQRCAGGFSTQSQSFRSSILAQAILFISVLWFSVPLFAQQKETVTLELFPEGHVLNPIRSSMIEPRLGILYYPVDGTLKVDIGNSIDLAKILWENGTKRITIGVDFMAYANAINYRDFRLQIRAMDGFFGGHMVYSANTENPSYFIRVRYIHNSSHLVDGNYDVYTNRWLDDKRPLAVARDFVEAAYIRNFFFNEWAISPYGGGFFSILLRPKSHKRMNGFTGVEGHSTSADPVYLRQPLHYFFSYYLQVSGVPEYQLTHEIQAGAKFGRWQGKGISLYANYFYGTNPFHIFFERRISRAGIGFTVDFP